MSAAGPGSTTEGLRARKRRETLQRITEAGVRLFVAQGYEATTLDEIAAAAGISRRTFFYYFKSKDDILLSVQSGVGDMLAGSIRAAPAGERPLDAARYAIVTVCGSLPAEDMIAMGRLMNASRTVMDRKQASYVEQEAAMFAALCERWPAPARETALRTVAMIAVGVMRIASDTLVREGGVRSFINLIDDTFEALAAEV